MYITKLYDGKTSHLERFNDLIEAFTAMFQWPHRCDLFIKPEATKPATLLAYKESENNEMPNL